MSDLDTLIERSGAYADLARSARELEQHDLADHADKVARDLDREATDLIDTQELTGYIVPVDPAELTNCEACQ